MILEYNGVSAESLPSEGSFLSLFHGVTINLSEADDFATNLIIHCQNPISLLCRGKLSCRATGIEPENTVPKIVLRPMTVTI